MFMKTVYFQISSHRWGAYWGAAVNRIILCLVTTVPINIFIGTVITKYSNYSINVQVLDNARFFLSTLVSIWTLLYSRAYQF